MKLGPALCPKCEMLRFLKEAAMNAKPTLVARVNDGSGRFPRAPVKIVRNNIKMPVEAFGRSFERQDIVGFYVRYSLDRQRHIDSLGKDPTAALSMFKQRELDVTHLRGGLLPIEPPKPTEAKDDRSLRTCASEFKANQVTLSKKKATIAEYSRAVDDLAGQYHDRSIDEITKQTCLAISPS